MLTDMAIRNFRPGPKATKLADGGGLFLLVTPAGGKLWRFKYRMDGHERLLALGSYPQVGLGEARVRHAQARELVARGVDPSREKQRVTISKKVDSEGTFRSLSEEYCKKRKNNGGDKWGDETAKRNEYLLSMILGAIGDMSIGEIEPIHVLSAIRNIERKGNLESARRTMQLTGAVFRYGVATARVKSDPTRDLRGALSSPTVMHHGALTEPRRVGELLRALDGYEGGEVVRIALQLAPYVFVRPGELRHAIWSEIDLNEAVWVIPAEKTKMRKEHQVPLSTQAVARLRDALKISGPSGYVFPSVRTRERPISDNTLNASLRRLGYSSNEMTVHGFRAMASTLLNESGKWSPDAIERALAHGDTDKVRAAYHRGAHWKERVKMAQWWGNYLDKLRSKNS